MKAITEHQPRATIIGLGVYTVVSRNHRAPGDLIGQRIAIHASKRQAVTMGRFHTWRLSFSGLIQEGMCEVIGEAQDAFGFGEQRTDHELPFGAIVATATLTACVPMIEWRSANNDVGRERNDGQGWIYPLDGSSLQHVDRVRIAHDDSDGWVLSYQHGQGVSRNVTDQLPYGDFRPGRWAWILEDAKTSQRQCPACGGAGGQGWIGDAHSGAPWTPCAHCWPRGDDGEFKMGYPTWQYDKHLEALDFGCEPIPARGSSGLWEWSDSRGADER